MTGPLLNRVKTKLRLTSKLRSTHLLHGTHAAYAKGRSFDLDELREYVPGDDVADIDWNASARATTTLVREHVAERRLRLCVALVGGANMRAQTDSGDTKWQIASDVAGALGFLAVRAGDEVGALIAAGPALVTHPYRTTESHLERILQSHQQQVIPAAAPESTEPAVDDTADSSVTELSETLASMMRLLKHRRLVAVIADSVPMTAALEQQLNRLGARHDVIWVEVADASPFAATQRGARDVQTGWSLAGVLLGNRKLQAEFAAAEETRRAQIRHSVEQHGGVYVCVNARATAITELLHALEVRANARRR